MFAIVPPAQLAPLVCAPSYNADLSYIYDYEEFEISDLINIPEMLWMLATCMISDNLNTTLC